MQVSVSKRVGLSLLLVAMMIALGGCDVAWWQVGPASFGLGYLTAVLFPNTTVEFVCFEDGVQVECSALPEFVE